jgi:hypothetical protein
MATKLGQRVTKAANNGPVGLSIILPIYPQTKVFELGYCILVEKWLKNKRRLLGHDPQGVAVHLHPSYFFCTRPSSELMQEARVTSNKSLFDLKSVNDSKMVDSDKTCQINSSSFTSNIIYCLVLIVSCDIIFISKL